MTIKLFGVKVEISFFFTALIALLLFLDKTGLMCVGLLSAVIHETGHLIAMLIVGAKPEKMRFCAYGVLINKNVNMKSRLAQMLVFSGGCIFNVAFAVVSALLWKNGAEGFIYFCAANIITALFSALPIKGLDGYDMLTLILSIKLPLNRAEKTASIIGAVFCFVPVAVFVSAFICGVLSINLMITSLYLIILFVCGL